MGFPILVRCRLYIESGPWLSPLGRGSGVSLYMAENCVYWNLRSWLSWTYWMCTYTSFFYCQTYIVGVVYHPPNSKIMDFHNQCNLSLSRWHNIIATLWATLILTFSNKHSHWNSSWYHAFILVLSYQSSIDPQYWPRIFILSSVTIIYTNHYNIKTNNYSKLFIAAISFNFPVFH